MRKETKSAASIGLLSFIAIVALAISFAPPTESYIKSRVVRLASATGSCSGEQVKSFSGVDYILSAAHCRHLGDGHNMSIITEDGRSLQRAIIAEDPSSDLLLIEGVPGMRGLDIAGESHVGERIRTFTHGLGMSTYKTEGTLIQDVEVIVRMGILTTPADFTACLDPKYQIVPIGFGMTGCILSVQETATDALIVPGSSGGAVVDADGAIVGVVSAGSGAFGYLVRLQDIKAFLRNY